MLLLHICRLRLSRNLAAWGVPRGGSSWGGSGKPSPRRLADGVTPSTRQGLG